MYIPRICTIPKTPNARVEFLLSFTSVYTIIISLCYTGLIMFNSYRDHAYKGGFGLSVGIIVTLLFMWSWFVNKRKYTRLSTLILISTILSISTLAGIYWGFDLPSTLLGFTMCIVLGALVASRKELVGYMIFIVSLFFLGNYVRHILDITHSWHNIPFGFDDVLEMVIIFTYIAALVIFSNREQHKLLQRSVRSEHALKKERDTLEVKVEERTREIKRLQMDEVAHMYRFVEFGKIAGGLFHDLMTPLQTLKLQLNDQIMPPAQLNMIKKTSNKLERMIMAARTQVKFDTNVTSFDVLEDIRDLLYITRHAQLKNNISVEIETTDKTHQLTTNRAIINHVLQNLLSNAFEACADLEDREAEVIVHLGYFQGKTYIAVEDNGVGIPKDIQDKIFEPFYSSKKKGENCGIGLSSAKHMLETYTTGHLVFESEEGLGTTMTIII